MTAYAIVGGPLQEEFEEAPFAKASGLYKEVEFILLREHPKPPPALNRGVRMSFIIDSIKGADASGHRFNFRGRRCDGVSVVMKSGFYCPDTQRGHIVFE